MQPKFIPPIANRSKTGMGAKKFVFIFAGLIIAVIVGILLMNLSSSTTPTDDMNKLDAQMHSVADIVNDGRKNVQNPDLAKITSDANILISGDLSLLTTAFNEAGLKADKVITANESSANTKLIAELKTAAIDGRYDAAYKDILTTKLETVQAQLKTVNDKSSRRAVKAATLSAYNHFESILTSIKALNL